MTALTADRNTAYRDGVEYSYPMVAATEIFAGSLVVLDTAGNAEPATDAASKIAVGRAEEYVNNTGAAAAKSIRVRAGIYKWANSGTNTPTKANIGDTLYIVDDQTVDTLATASSPAGIMVDFETGFSWVETKVPAVTQAGLAVANNLSDVGTAATAATNLGLGTADSPTFAGLTLDDAIMKHVSVAVTAAELRDLVANNKTIVAAVASKIMVPLKFCLHYVYGSEVFAEPSAPDELAFNYVGAAGTRISAELDAGAIIVPANDTLTWGDFVIALEGATVAEAVNVPITLDNTGANYTGNASNDGVLNVHLTYLEISAP